MTGGIRAAAALAVGWLLAAAVGSPAAAEDSDRLRWYGGIRYELAPGATRAHDIIGGVVGVNLDRHIGLEVALDAYERKVGDVSELGVTGIVPQLRFRYPLRDRRLVPYLLAGVGMAVTQANDARATVQWERGKTQVLAAGTVGLGIEYFILDNIAIGVEAKQFLSGGVNYEAKGAHGRTGISAGLLTFGVRVFYPELDPAALAASARAAKVRFFLDLRTGGGWLIDSTPFPGLVAGPEQRFLGTDFTFEFGVTVGATIGRYASLELAMDNYEIRLGFPGEPKFGEYSVFPILVQSRLRYPLLDDALEPYVLLGVGGEYAQINDLTGAGKILDPKGRDVTFVAAFGLGIEYALLDNVRLGLSGRYLLSRGHEIRFPGQAPITGTLDMFMMAGHVRIFFWDLFQSVSA